MSHSLTHSYLAHVHWRGYRCFYSQGSARRKKKVVHKTATDDKKLQVSVNITES